MISAILLLVAILTASWVLLWRRPRNFPPGPLGFPIVGHLPLVGQSPHKTLLEWKKTYGPIIGVQFGSFRTVVINDAKLIREALNTHAISGRPPVKPHTARSGGTPKGILFTSGQVWLNQRRFTLKAFRDFGFGKRSMEDKIQDEIIEVVDRFAANAGKPMQMRNVFNVAVLNALWSIMFGERMQQDDPELLEAVRGLISSMDDVNLITSPGTFMPWLANVAPKLSGYDAIMKEIFPLIAFIKKHVDRHNLTHKDNQPRDYIDAYVDEMNKTTDPNSPFHKDQGHLPFAIFDLFIGGGETTSTTLAWLVAYMVTYPEIQAKFQKEIDNVIGRERLPSLSDRSSMKYTEALLNEVMRFSSLLPLALFHYTTEDVEFHGYSIPKETIVLSNLYSVHYDASVWGDPQNFRPERFLDDEGNVKKIDSLVPFGMGKRACLGERLARDELFLFATQIFQKFQASPAEKLPNLDPCVGITLPPRPFEAILTVRL